MTSTTAIRPQAGAPLSAGDILANARTLAEEVRDQDLASEYDRLRKLPPDIVEKVRAAGIMRMNMPRIWGGPEMTPMEQVEVIEALCRADASIGWCSFIWTDSGIYSGYLDDSVAREMYPHLDMATSGWVYPQGRAERVDGGYRLSGQWMFGSGCNHCDWLAAGCVVFENGEPALREGQPEWRIMLAKPSEYVIEDTWYTTGLRGTGSCDYHCQDVFIPEAHTFAFTDAPKREGSIWKAPDHLLRKMAGVPLGVAGDALDSAREMLQGKTDRISGVLYRDMPRVQTAIAEAHLKLASARSYVFTSLERQWAKLERDEPLTEEERSDVWLSRLNAFQTGRDVVRGLYDAIGASAIYTKNNAFDRHLRDLQTACQHMVGQPKSLENVGSLLLGGASGQTMI